MNKIKLAEDGKEATTDRRMMMENGHPGVEIDENAIRRGENPYQKYFAQQGEVPSANGQVCLSIVFLLALENNNKDGELIEH